MDTLPALLLAFAAFAFVAWKVKTKTSSTERICLPPGPRGDPFIGHLRLIPSQGQDMFFYELGKIYGDVVQLKILGKSMIILNSVEAAMDLLDKRSANYSDRPDFPLMELLGMDDTLAFAKYGKNFRTQRRMVHQYFTNIKRKEHRPIQTREARVLAQNLLLAPEKWDTFLIRFAAAIIIQIAYGHKIVSNDDPYFKIAEENLWRGRQLGTPGATPIDLFPFLKYLPSWFPGTHYANFARDSYASARKFREYPYEQMLEQIRNGTALSSFLLSQLQGIEQGGPEAKATINQIQAVSCELFIAGADTTSASLAFFVLAMVLYPECQAKAQEEIDAIVGFERLPEFYDRDNLPYLECLVQETLRWRHTAPTGIPHMSIEDDVYKGMLILKGSTIITNIRGMTLNETVYHDPFEFDPSRYLPAPVGRGEPFSASHFGFGRRICPGRLLADDNMWIAIATTLATIKFSKALDENGKEIIPDATPIASGVVNHPKPFKCRLEPRTKVATELLEQSTEN